MKKLEITCWACNDNVVALKRLPVARFDMDIVVFWFSSYYDTKIRFD